MRGGLWEETAMSLSLILKVIDNNHNPRRNTYPLTALRFVRSLCHAFMHLKNSFQNSQTFYPLSFYPPPPIYKSLAEGKKAALGGEAGAAGFVLPPNTPAVRPRK